MFDVMFTTSGNATVRLNKLSHKFEQTREGLVEIAELIAERNEARWGEGVQLKASTLEWKERYGDTQEPLVETNRMKEELTNPEQGIKRLSNTELVFGSSSKAKDSEYAKAFLMQHGTRKMAPKKVMQVDVGTKVLMRQIMHKKLGAD